MIKKAVIATGVFAISAMAAATLTFAQSATPSAAPTTSTTTVTPTTAASAPTAAPATGRAAL